MDETTRYQCGAAHMMVRERTGHSQAVMARVLVVNKPGAFLVGALSAIQVGYGSFPPLQPSQEALHAWEVVGKGNILIPQGVNTGEGKDCVSCDWLGGEVQNEIYTLEAFERYPDIDLGILDVYLH